MVGKGWWSLGDYSGHEGEARAVADRIWILGRAWELGRAAAHRHLRLADCSEDSAGERVRKPIGLVPTAALGGTATAVETEACINGRILAMDAYSDDASNRGGKASR